MESRLLFKGKKLVELEEFELAELKSDEVLIRNRHSLISSGTEGIVFNRLFDDGTHWDDWVEYPFYPGYAAFGEVVEIGADVSALKVGDSVVHRGNHASAATVNENEVLKVPDGVSAEEAAWFALAKITFMGAKAANYFLGDRVLIVGAGPIGQMSVRWARASGASKIISVDFVPERLELAKRGGADVVFSQALSDETVKMVEEANDGELPDIVIDTTGNAKVFTACLKHAKQFGKVVLLGDTGSPAQQHLSPDVIIRGVSIVGAHDGHSGGEWPDQRIFELFFTLLRTGRFPMKGMNSHSFKPEQCLEAYNFLTDHRDETMGVVFDWS